MKILRLKLVNYIGIKSGLDKDEIEITIPDNDIPFIMLVGRNGCGKSTILSQMHPFKESFDDRKSLIIPGRIGIKEFDFEIDGDVYKVKHVFDKKTSSFITLNGEELNPSGGVRTFEDVIFQKLGLSKDYMKIGKLGSNIGDFVHSSTSERKELISSFVSEVLKYIEASGVVNEKFKMDNDKLKTIAKELGTYPETPIIEADLNQAKDDLVKVDDLIVKNSSDIAVAEKELSTAKQELETIDYIRIKDDIVRYSKDQAMSKSVMDNLKLMYSETPTFLNDVEHIEDFDTKVQNLRITKSVAESELNQLKNRLVELTNNQTKTEYKLNGLGNASTSLSDLIKETDNIKTKIDSLDVDIEANPLKCFVSNIDDLPYMIKSYTEFMTFILQNYSQLNGETLQPKITNIDLFCKKNAPDIIKSAVINSRNSIASSLENKTNLEKENAIKHASIGKLDILAKRPSACSINECPFIADAIQYKDLPSEIAKLEDRIATLNANIESMNAKAEWINDIKDLFKMTVTQYRMLNPSVNVIYRYQASIHGEIATLMKQPINFVKEIYEASKAYAEQFLDHVNEKNRLQATYDRNKRNIEEITSSSNIRKMYEDDLAIIIADVKELSTDIAAKSTKITELGRELTTREAYIRDLNLYADKMTEFERCTMTLENLNKIKTRYEDLNRVYQTRLSECTNLNSLVLNAKEDKVNIQTAITNAEIALSRINELKKSQKELQNTYALLKLVKDALDPKSGIPLIFIQSYLGKTELIANELLNIAFNGKFEIHFQSNAKEFFIQVRSKDAVIEDISSASQGEVALTTISISLALIEQYSGRFNILALDEMDGTLDDANRETFISILDSQIQKLGIEQVFIISHNNAFDNVPMNIIALPGSERKMESAEFMSNKTVIADYRA